MSKLNQLIELKDLANAYSTLIGKAFEIKVNVETNVDPLRPSAIMFATRQPYKISNIKAESLQVALRFYVCCELEEDYNETIKILSQLVGLNKGSFVSNEKNFKYFSYLDFARPLGDPEVNSGKFFQTLELMGTCLVTQTKGGVLIANELSTNIVFNPDANNELSGEIEVLSSTTALVKAQESPQMANAVVGKAINLTQTFSYSYTILILKNSICERIVKALENIEPIGVNELIKIIDKYPAFTDKALESIKNVTLTGGQINRNAGTFVTAQLSFQDKLEIKVEEETTEPELPCTVTIDPTVTITNIVGDYKINENGTLSCELGTIISVSIDGLSYKLTHTGVTSVKTSGSEIVTPLTYDLTIIAVEATINTLPKSSGNGSILI